MANSTDVTYQVTGQEGSQDFSGGTPTPGVNVTIKASNGYTDTVFIPDTAMGDPEQVRQLIENRVRVSKMIGALTGKV